tara:strand:- start:1459 stop:1791 length:333 start_codon:yes stop_codon:yes gene_type:complete
MFEKANQIVFPEIKDTRTGKNFILKKYEEYSDVDELKQSLKLLNFNYKVVRKKGLITPLQYFEEKISTKDIDNKELLAHIEWVIKLCAENDILLPMVQEDWDMMIQMYNR